jgi:short-subunit dehydrogenase
MLRQKHIVLIGNSDGIGLALTQRLLDMDAFVTGISRSQSPITHHQYDHIVCDVSREQFKETLVEVVRKMPKVDIMVYLAGVLESLDWNALSAQSNVFKVNLMGAVLATEVALTTFLAQNFGHFIGLSSLADMCLSPRTPSYAASKIGISWYWEGLGLANKNPHIHITNIRFGFVTTKISRLKFKLFSLSRESAVDFILTAIKKPQVRATNPYYLVPFGWAIQIWNRILIVFK